MNIYKEIYVTRKEQVIVQTTQYTNAVPLVFRIMDWEVPTAANAAIYVKKPSGLIVFNTASVGTQNEIVANMTTQMTAEVGNNECQIKITNGEDVLNSFVFTLQIEQTIVDDGAIESTDEFTALEEALSRVGDVVTHSELAGKGSVAVPVYFDADGSAKPISSPLPIANGGTGGADLNTARTNLQGIGFESSAANASIGSLVKPVYIYRDSNGRFWARPVTYELNKSVPADAVFTDTTDLTDMIGTLPKSKGGTGGTGVIEASRNLQTPIWRSTSAEENIGSVTRPVYISYDTSNGGHFIELAKAYPTYMAEILSVVENQQIGAEDISVPSGTATELARITLQSGFYIIDVLVRWDNATAGRRQIGFTGSTLPMSAISTCAPSPSSYTYQHLTMLKYLSTAQTFKLNGTQTSGGELNATARLSYLRIAP